MRRIFLLSVLAIVLVGCSGEEAKKIFHLSDGSSMAYSDVKSEFVLINYWASWCKPCVKEIPELNALNEHEDVAVFAYNFDRLEGEALQQEADKFKLKLPMMLNEPAPLFEEPSPSALPATLVLHPQSGAKRWLVGPQTKQGILKGIGLN